MKVVEKEIEKEKEEADDQSECIHERQKVNAEDRMHISMTWANFYLTFDCKKGIVEELTLTKSDFSNSEICIFDGPLQLRWKHMANGHKCLCFIV